MIRSSVWRAAMMATLMCGGSLCGCDEVADVDGGADASLGDAGASDGGPGDAGEVACVSPEVEVRGVCLAPCGGDVSALDGAAAAGLRFVANVCRTGSARSARGSDVFELSAVAEGSETSFELERWPLATPASITTVVSATHDTGDVAELIFAGGFVALSPSGARAVFGYTTNVDFAGGVFVADPSGGTSERVDALGNYDAAFLDDDTVLVNGLGLVDTEEGQGLYAGDLSGATVVASHVGSNLGGFSGSVVVGDGYVLVGGVDGTTFAGRVFATSIAALEAAITSGTPIDFGFDGVSVDAGVVEALDPDGLAVPSTFGRIADDRVVFTPFGGPITAYRVAWDGTDLTLSEEAVLATGDTFSSVTGAGSQLLLGHGSGVLVVEEP